MYIYALLLLATAIAAVLNMYAYENATMRLKAFVCFYNIYFDHYIKIFIVGLSYIFHTFLTLGCVVLLLSPVATI